MGRQTPVVRGDGSPPVLASAAEPSAVFTPGPWRVSALTYDFGRVIRGDRDAYIAKVGENVGEWQANARLIAAAPDLLGALIAAKRALWADARQSWTLSDFKNWAVVQQIDGALNKARGRDAASPAGAQPKAPDEPKSPSLGADPKAGA